VGTAGDADSSAVGSILHATIDATMTTRDFGWGIRGLVGAVRLPGDSGLGP
jgi:hypothetical protein